MKTIKRILCPVDIYDFQPEAAACAMTLANALDAEITVVYVMEPLPSRYFGEGGPVRPPFAEEEAVRRRVEEKLPEIISEFFTARADKCEVVFGQPADQIIRIAEECSADMIIMASHGRSALGRIIHGSVTNKVLASAKIPVLVVQPSKKEE